MRAVNGILFSAGRLLAVLGVLAPALRAEEGPPAGQPLQQVPRAEGLELDGRPVEAAWQGALRLPADSFEAPPPPPATEKVTLTPDVRLLEAGGALWIAVSVAEDPGMGVGLRIMAGPDGLTSAADAVSVGFAPQ